MSKSYREKGKKSKKKYAYMGGGIILLILFIMVGNALWWAPVDTPVAKSTFTTTSYVDGEEVSEWTELSIWTPKASVTFDTVADYHTLTNYEETISSSHADDISIDLSIYDSFYVEVQASSSVWANNFHYYTTQGDNKDYNIRAIDQSSDVNFNILDMTTMGVISAGALDGNYTCIMDVPHYTTTNSHSGTNWEKTTAIVSEMSVSELEDLYDEANYQLQAPIYNPTDDAIKTWDNGLDKITDAFAIKLTFNASISVIDGVDTQVNISLTESAPISVCVSGEYVYFIYTEAILFNSGVVNFNFKCVTALNITYTTAQSGRVLTPYNDDNLSTFTAYSTIGA